LADFSERIIGPAMSVLAANIESDVLSNVYKDVYNQVNNQGSAGTFAKVLQGRKQLVDNLAPTDNRMVNLNTQDNVDLVDAALVEQPKHSQLMADRATAAGQVARLKSGQVLPLKQTDPQLAFTVTRLAPKKIQIEGTAQILNLSKLRAIFKDKDYDRRAHSFANDKTASFDFKMSNCSLEWFDMTVNKRRFKWVLDLNKDPAEMERNPEEIYPLKADEYELSVLFNPRYQAAFIQDLYGWNGEGLTAAPGQLKVDDTRAANMNGKRGPLRYVERTLTLTRDDIMGKGQKVLFKGS